MLETYKLGIRIKVTRKLKLVLDRVRLLDSGWKRISRYWIRYLSLSFRFLSSSAAAFVSVTATGCICATPPVTVSGGRQDSDTEDDGVELDPTFDKSLTTGTHGPAAASTLGLDKLVKFSALLKCIGLSAAVGVLITLAGGGGCNGSGGGRGRAE